MTARVKIRLEGMDRLIEAMKRLDDEVMARLEDVAREGIQPMLDAANGRAPKAVIEAKTTRRDVQRVEVSIGPNKDHWYYIFFETGAKPHEIKGNPLAFEGEAGVVITKSVNHPGVTPRPFLRPAFDENVERSEDEVKKAINRIIG